MIISIFVSEFKICSPILIIHAGKMGIVLYLLKTAGFGQEIRDGLKLYDKTSEQSSSK